MRYVTRFAASAFKLKAWTEPKSPSARMESRELQPQIRTKKRHSSQRDSKSPKVDFENYRRDFQYDRELGNRRWKAENRLPIAEARLRKHGDY